jgi:hypothetical protein
VRKNFFFDGVVFHTIYMDRLEGGGMAHAETVTGEAGFGINLNLAMGGNFFGGSYHRIRCSLARWKIAV